MDFLDELLPAGYLLKPEVTSKDKHQKPKQKKYKKESALAKSDEQDGFIEIRRAVSSWNDADRRKGDRRKQFVKRGRWLESRSRNDRRAENSEIFVKI